jgi:beta-lactamase regulating signal transducer with metallopeptidase domain
MAHERAHLTYRHHQLKGLARVGRQVLPFLPLMRRAEAEIERLVELHADDVAAGRHDRRRLATALVLLATASSPAATLAAGATEVVARVQRLSRPVETLGRARRRLLGLSAAALALTPVLLALTPAAVALSLGRVHPA